MYIHIYIHRACESSLSSIDLVCCRNIRKETHKNPKRDPQISKKRHMYIHVYIHRACKSSLSSIELFTVEISEKRPTNIQKETHKHLEKDTQISKKRPTNVLDPNKLSVVNALSFTRDMTHVNDRSLLQKIPIKERTFCKRTLIFNRAY